MLSKEEIEKAEERFNKLKENANIEDVDMNDCFGGEHIEAIETLLQYIDQLEKSDASKEQSSMNYYNKYKELKQENKKLNKMNNEMAEQLAGIAIWNIEKDEPIILGDKEEVKKYFEKKVEKDNVKN